MIYVVGPRGVGSRRAARMDTDRQGPVFEGPEFLTQTENVVKRVISLVQWHNKTCGPDGGTVDSIRWCTIGGGSQLPEELTSVAVSKRIEGALSTDRSGLLHLLPQGMPMMPAVPTALSLASDTPSSLIHLISRLPANCRRAVEDRYLRVYRQLMSADWPLSHSRTNVLPLGAEYAGVHTVSVGLLVHNDGETRMSSSFGKLSALARDINLLLTTLIDACDLPQVSWTALRLNKDYASRMHVDSRNIGESLILAIGNWTEGGRFERNSLSQRRFATGITS